MKRIRVGVLGIVLSLVMACPTGGQVARPRPPRRRPEPGKAEIRALRVDAGEVIGTIRALQGVNVGPAHTRTSIPPVIEQYKNLRIDSVRTHDFYGPTDIDAWRPDASWDTIIFPDRDADPENEASYSFGPSDRVVKAIVDCGADVYYRLGRSWGAVADPPPEPAKFAAICRHIVMHYNEGWAEGHRFNIRYWEVWNEPNGHKFWTGTPQQFWQLYETVARTLKAHDPELKVGTCGLAGGMRGGPYREGLIAFCEKRRVPLDFYSWHHYHLRTGGNPHDMVEIAREVRGLLDRHGFHDAENHITEWNLALGRQGQQHQVSLNAAAFTASVLTYLQDAPVQIAHYYRGDGAHPMGLFRSDGSYYRKAFAFKAMGIMLDTPERLALFGADAKGFAALAGRSGDGKTVQVLVSNYIMPGEEDPHPTRQAFRLTIKNLPWGDVPFTVKRYRLTESEDLDMVEEAKSRGSVFEVTRPLKPSAVELLTLRADPSA